MAQCFVSLYCYSSGRLANTASILASEAARVPLVSSAVTTRQELGQPGARGHPGVGASRGHQGPGQWRVVCVLSAKFDERGRCREPGSRTRIAYEGTSNETQKYIVYKQINDLVLHARVAQLVERKAFKDVSDTLWSRVRAPSRVHPLLFSEDNYLCPPQNVGMPNGAFCFKM